MTLEVLYCDNHMLAVSKPAGQPSVPDDSGDESLYDEAREWVRVEFNKPGDAFLGVVHRLDRPVSGVVVFARTSKGAARLSAQFGERQTVKTYWGIVHGAPAERSGTVHQWLSKDASRNRVHVHSGPTDGAKEALTQWRVLRGNDEQTLLELRPLTGRSHQLRITARTLATPLLGDLKYGAPEPLSDKSIALHARRLEIDHPTLPERMVFRCDPPARRWWQAFGVESGD